MKYFFYSLFIFNTCVLFPQNIGSNGVKSDSRINDLFELIKNRISKNSYSNLKIKGSEYFDEKFKPADIKYFDKLKNSLESVISLKFSRFSAFLFFTEFPKIVNEIKTKNIKEIAMANFWFKKLIL